MSQCIELAKRGSAFVAPNPMVGCIVVYNEKVVSEGHHEFFGGPHAEVVAINSLTKDIDPRQSELYVNLEPCAHHGKTPPCADLIIEKGFKKVVIGSLDPNPEVAGKGADKLRAAGIEVVINILQKECEHLNRKFYFFHTNKLPYICLKWAETKDGFIGRHIADLYSGKQISGEESKEFVHQLRAEHMALMIGARTANLDNPKLTVRHVKGRDPLKLIVSRNNTVESSLRLLKEGQTWIFNTLSAEEVNGLRFVKLNRHTFLEEMLEYLHKQGVQSVLVEGGSQLAQSLIDHGYWNECYRICSPLEWKKGVPAPEIKARETEIIELGSDKVLHYLNR